VPPSSTLLELIGERDIHHYWIVVDGGLLVVVALAIALRNRRIRLRRVILERELQSIHSSAIVWQAVLLAHHRALDGSENRYDHYTERLAEQAQSLAERPFEVHDWLQRTA